MLGIRLVCQLRGERLAANTVRRLCYLTEVAKLKKSILLLLVLCLSIPLTSFLASDTAVADDPVNVELVSVDFRPSPTAGGVFVMTPRVKNISATQDYHVKAVFGYAFDKDKYDCPLEWPYDVNKYPESSSTQSQEIDWAKYQDWEEDYPFETPLLHPVFETSVESLTVVDLPLLLETNRDVNPGEYNVPYVIFYREWITDRNGDGECDAGDEYGDWQHISRLKTIDLRPAQGQDSFVDVDETIVWVDLDNDRELDWVGQDEDGNWNDDANENGYMDPGEGEVRGAIDPGESFYVTLRIENKGTYAATNIQVKLAYEETRPQGDESLDYIVDALSDLLGMDVSALLGGQEPTSEYQGEAPFTPVRDSVEFIQALEPGEEAEAVFSLKATSSAQSDLYNVPVSILFQDDAGNDAPVVVNMVGIEVGGTPRFEIAGVTTDPSTVRAGDRYTIEVQLENIGSQVAKSVSVRLFDGEEEVAQEQFLGSMEPGSIGIAIFDAKAGQEGLTELGVEIDYLQESDGVFTPVTVQARSVKLDVLPEAGISTLTWVVVAVVVIAAVVLGIVLWRRRSKGEEDEGEWGGPQDGLWGGGPQNKEWMARAEGEKVGAQSDVVASHVEESVTGLAAETACSTDEASAETYRVRIVKPKETPAPVVIGEPLVQPAEYEEEEAQSSPEERGRLRRMFGWMRPRRPFKRSAVAESAEVADPVIIEPAIQAVQYEGEEAESSTEKRGKLRRMSSWMRSKRPFIVSWENVPWSRETRLTSENGEQWSPNSRIGGLAKDRLMRQDVRADNPEGEVAAG